MVGGFIILLIYRVAPLTAYWALLYGAFGRPGGLSETLLESIPLMLTALGYAVAFKCQVFNIGGEGQIYMGALIGTWVALTLPPNLPLLLPLVIISGCLGGAAWGAIAGFLRAQWGVNIIVSTMMMNYIAILLVNWAVSGPMQAPGIVYPVSSPLPTSAWLPTLFGSNLDIGFLIGLIIAPLLYILLTRTVVGYQIRAMGANPEASRYAGIREYRNILLSMVISAGLAGLAGVFEITGRDHMLLMSFSPSYGYTAVIVALVGSLNPFGVVLSSIFFGAIENGASIMSYNVGIPVYFSSLMQALVIFFFLAGKSDVMDKSGIFKFMKRYLFRIGGAEDNGARRPSH